MNTKPQPTSPARPVPAKTPAPASKPAPSGAPTKKKLSLDMGEVSEILERKISPSAR